MIRKMKGHVIQKLSNKSILYIVHDYLAFTKDQIELLSKQFKEVNVLIRYKPIAELAKFFPIPLLQAHKLSNIIDIKNLPKNVHLFPVSLWYLPTNKGYKKLGEKHYKKVEEVIKRKNIKFDIVHAHFIWSSGYVGMKLKEKYGVPFVVTGHGYDVYELPFRDKEWGGQIKKILSTADKIITVSRNNEKCIKKLDNKYNVHVIGNGYLESKFFNKEKEDCRKRLNLPRKSQIILNVGGLHKVKGQIYLIDAISILIKNGYNIKCYILGEGELKNTLKNKISKLGLSESVFLMGAIPHTDLVDWFNSADIFVLPSISEGFPLVQLESLACGVPIVASRNNGSIEVFTSEDYGLLCKIGDSNDLSEKIAIALEKPWDKNKILQYAKNYTWENACSKVLEIYEDLL